MKIALHCGFMNGAGASVVGRAVLKHLPREGPQHEILAWVPQSWQSKHDVSPRTVAENVTLRFVTPGIPQKFVLENWIIRRSLSSWGADVLLSLSDTSMVGCSIPHMLMIHQPNLAYGPEERDFPLSAKMRLRWYLMGAYLRLGLGSVSRLTVQTEDMASRISTRFGYPRDRIAIVPSAVELVQSSGELPQELNGVAPYVTYVSSASAHKNFKVLAPMMAKLHVGFPELQCRLTVTPEDVPELTREIQRLGLRDAFVFHGRVSRDMAVAMIRGARALVMPSKLESFGLPYYEAMAEGTPVVAADRAFAREACGSAGAYADADSGADFAARVAALVEDDELRRARSEESLKRFQEVMLPWDAVAREYLRLLEGLRGNT